MQNLRHEYRDKETKTRTNLQTGLITTICWILILLGSASLIISIISTSQILAFVGLGLVFWGIILLFVQPEKYTKKVLLDAALSSSLETLNQIIEELGYSGKAIYLPPRYFKDPETNKAYLPKQPEEEAPEPNLILNQENNFFLKDQKAILFTPPGAQLTKLFEKRLGTNFAHVDLDYIRQNLPKLFIDDLEIAENLEIDIKTSESSTQKNVPKYGTIHVKITDSIFKDTCKANNSISKIYGTIDSPISSAIACVLTKVTGKPLIIKETKSSENGKIIEITYQIEKLEYYEQPELEYNEQTELEYYEQPKKQLIEPAKLFTLNPLFQKLPSLILIILGFVTLVWIGQYTWIEVAIHEADLSIFLFDYETAEFISLGIGMKVIYYYLLGLALLSLGIMTSSKRGKNYIAWLSKPPTFSKLLSLFLIIFGSIMLIWVSELTLYELIIWAENKSLEIVLFGNRIGEIIGLGIGMKVIYYFLIGSVLLFSGILSYIKQRGEA